MTEPAATEAPAQTPVTEEPPAPTTWRERIAAGIEKAQAGETGPEPVDPPPLAQEAGDVPIPGSEPPEPARARDPETGKFVAAEPEPVAAEAAPGDDPNVLQGDGPDDPVVADPVEPVEDPVEPVGIEVELPGRVDGETFKMSVASQEEADRLKQLTNDAMRRKEFNRQMEPVLREKAELDFIAKSLKENPAEFVAAQVAPEIQAQLAANILAGLPPDAFNEVVGRVRGWERDPRGREMDRVAAENERLRQAEERRQQAAAQETTQTAAQQIQRAIVELVPDEMDDGKADRFYRLAVLEVQQHIRERGLRSFPAEDVQAFLGQRGVLGDFGIGLPGTSAPGPAPAGSGTQDQGAIAQERIDRRREASTVSPSGVGASAASFEDKPAGQTVDERLKWFRKRMGL